MSTQEQFEAAKAEHSILRRNLLKALPFTIAAAIPAAAAAKPDMSPRERFDAAREEFKAASEALYPEIKTWRDREGNPPCPVILVALVS